jgi:transposase
MSSERPVNNPKIPMKASPTFFPAKPDARIEGISFINIAIKFKFYKYYVDILSMAYSKDFREAAIKFKEAGHSFAELKEVFAITPQTYYNWLDLKEETGKLEARKVKRRQRKIDPTKLEQVVKEKPDAYLSEIAVAFNCTPQAVFAALKRNNITYKKTLSTPNATRKRGRST